MNTRVIAWGLIAGWVGGFLGNGLLGAIYSSSIVHELLYDPRLQSELFMTVTPQRNVVVSVIGLVILSGIHGVLFAILRDSIPGVNWVRKGLFWGLAVWAMYWLFQEWFIYITLLQEPLSLAAIELCILLAGTLFEGVVIAAVNESRNVAIRA